jgi:hypothetical protein
MMSKKVVSTKRWLGFTLFREPIPRSALTGRTYDWRFSNPNVWIQIIYGPHWFDGKLGKSWSGVVILNADNTPAVTVTACCRTERALKSKIRRLLKISPLETVERIAGEEWNGRHDTAR